MKICQLKWLLLAITVLGYQFFHSLHGESLWTNDQLLIDVCTGCHDYIEKDRLTHHGLLSPQEHYDAFGGYDEIDAAADSTEQHILSAYKFFRRQYSDYLMAVGSHNYNITEPKGGGYWAINFNFVNMAVSSDMPDDIECSHVI